MADSQAVGSQPIILRRAYPRRAKSRPAEALRLFRQAFDANPNDTEAYIAYERLLRQMGDTAARISLYLSKATLLPEAAGVWTKRAAYLHREWRSCESH